MRWYRPYSRPGPGSPASADLRPCAAAADSVVSLAIASPLGTSAAPSLRTPRGHALRRTDVAPGLEVSFCNILEDRSRALFISQSMVSQHIRELERIAWRQALPPTGELSHLLLPVRICWRIRGVSFACLLKRLVAELSLDKQRA